MFPIIYDIIYTIIFLLYVPIFLGKSIIKNKPLANLKERLGFISPVVGARVNLTGARVNSRRVLIHAVSVGELISVKYLVERMKEEMPYLHILISIITPAAYKLINEKFNNKYEVHYFPFDWSFAVKNFLKKLKPDLVILVESEFWLNFLYYCNKNKIPILLINGRISERAFKWYRIIRRWLCKKLNIIQKFYMQSKADAERLKKIGVEEAKIKILGNLKYDVKPNEKMEGVEEVKKWLKDNPCILVGSSMKGEEGLFLNIYAGLKKKFPSLKLIIAPRHPERFNEVSDLIISKGLSLCKRSEGKIKESEVFLLDSVGELASLYQLSTVVIIGGSFLPYGGHNIIEPAYFAKPIIIGNHMENFKEMAEEFLINKGCLKTDINNLLLALEQMLDNDKLRDELGKNAYKVVRKNAGVTERIINELKNIIASL